METHPHLRVHRQALWLVVALIVYGSLFPFHFHPHVPAWADAAHLLLPQAQRMPLSDLIGNTLLFLPLGALLRSWRGFLSGAALALGLQYLQFWFPDRDPNGVDALVNLGGMLAGYLGWRLTAPHLQRWRSADLPRPHFVYLASALMALWLLYRWFPLVPTLDPQNLKNGVKPLLEWRSTSWIDVVRNLAGWLVFVRLARYSLLQRWTPIALSALCVFIVAAQPLFQDNAVSAANLAGMLLALLLSGSQRKGAGSMAWLVLLLVFSVSLAALVPFALGDPQGFGWIPFAGSLTGDPLRSVPSWIEKCFLYGSLVFLLRYLGGTHRSVCLGVGGLLLALELAQVWLPGRTPEITDPLLALVLAFFMRPVFDRGRTPATR